jgi:hypothetical protein
VRVTSASRTVLAASIAVAGAACGSLLGYEDEYLVAPPDASGAAGDGGDASGDAASAGSGGAGAQSGALPCAHLACVGGEELDPTCDPCVAEVCAASATCCEVTPDLQWNADCVGLAQQLCETDCCGDGLCLNNSCSTCPKDCGECQCPHSVCAAGAALTPEGCRDPCVGKVCAQMSTCCMDFGWTTECMDLSAKLCGPDPCVAKVCAALPGCCHAGAWDDTCVQYAKTECGVTCEACAHPLCGVGDPLVPACDPCVVAVCDADEYCCDPDGRWDANCVAEVQTICGLPC